MIMTPRPKCNRPVFRVSIPARLPPPHPPSRAMSFSINVNHEGVITAHDVLPSDTLRILRARLGLGGERFARGRQSLGLDQTFDELGVAAGANLRCFARPLFSGEAQAQRRLQAGASRASIHYPHLCKFVATDGGKTRRALEPIAGDDKAAKDAALECKKELGLMRANLKKCSMCLL